MGVFTLKYRDTRPILQVTLHDPADEGEPEGTLGPVHDLTGSTAWKLHIRLSDGTELIRDMVKVGLDTDGTLKYTWVDGDWATGAGGTGADDDPFTSGGLVVGPTLPLSKGVQEHTMDYEVIGPGDARTTFPNGEEDILRIRVDIGQG